MPQHRDFESQPYSPDEQRVASWLMAHGIGGGDDPIGFILSSLEFAMGQLVQQKLCD